MKSEDLMHLEKEARSYRKTATVKAVVTAINSEPFEIDTPEGPHQVSPGDYIVWNEGHPENKWPVKPDIFRRSYEEIE